MSNSTIFLYERDRFELVPNELVANLYEHKFENKDTKNYFYSKHWRSKYWDKWKFGIGTYSLQSKSFYKESLKGLTPLTRWDIEYVDDSKVCHWISLYNVPDKSTLMMLRLSLSDHVTARMM